MTNKNLFNKRVSINIKLIWLLVTLLIIFLITLLCFLIFVTKWNTSHAVEFTSKATLTALAFCTLVYHLHNMELQLNVQQRNNKQNLSKYTYDICSDFRRPNMSVINENLKILLSKHEATLSAGSYTEFLNFIEEPTNKRYRRALIITINYFESISVMVLANDLDNDIVKRLFGKLFGRYYIILTPYIKYRQKESPKSWVNFEKLTKKWINEDRD